MLDQNPRRRGLASRTATAITLTTVLTLSAAAVWLATSEADSRVADPNQSVSFPRETGVGACLRLVRRPVDPEPLVDALAGVAIGNDHFFPTLDMTTIGAEPRDGLIVALWPVGAPPEDQAIRVAQDATPCSHVDAGPSAVGGGWSFALTHDLLSDAADRLLERADFGSEWIAHIEVTLHPKQAQVRTKLDFSGPLGITGSCWMDEIVVIDLETGLPDVERKSGNDAGLPGLVACRRFEQELDAGGAAAQALALFPPALVEEDADITLAVTDVDVTDEMIIVSGRTR